MSPECEVLPLNNSCDADALRRNARPTCTTALQPSGSRSPDYWRACPAPQELLRTTLDPRTAIPGAQVPRCADKLHMPLRSAMVTSNGYDPEELDDLGDDPFVVGWWVGPDGNWHPPDEPFGAGTEKRPHPLRRVVVVLLAVAIVVATTVSVLAGGSPLTTSSSTGPSLAELTYQVQQTVTGSGSGQSGVRGVTSVKCHPPSTWSSGQTFTCDIFGPSRKELGQYHGTIQPTTSSGEWRWEGAWKPAHQYSVA